jgi:hypothetical protein
MCVYIDASRLGGCSFTFNFNQDGGAMLLLVLQDLVEIQTKLQGVSGQQRWPRDGDGSGALGTDD